MSEKKVHKVGLIGAKILPLHVLPASPADLGLGLNQSLISDKFQKTNDLEEL